jgi:hypothetical protein
MKAWKLLSAVALVAGLGVGTAALAEVTETTTTTTTSGTVSDLTSGALIVKSETDATPSSYSYSKTTTYVDEDGNPVSIETVKSGAPVTVYYSKGPDGLVASKVVVRKHVDPVTGKTTIEEKRTKITP